MATYLELCQQVEDECGIENRLSTTVGVTGMHRNITRWVNASYQEIQQSRNDWSFLDEVHSFNTIIGVSEYPSVFSTINEPTPNTVKIGDNNLLYVDVDTYYDDYYGTSDTGKPTHYSYRRDKSFQLYPTPDSVYTVVMKAQLKPQTLSLDSDTTIIPTEYEDAIVWKACVKFADHEEAQSFRQTSFIEYKNAYNRMLLDLKKRDPRIKFNGGFA